MDAHTSPAVSIVCISLISLLVFTNPLFPLVFCVYPIISHAIITFILSLPGRDEYSDFLSGYISPFCYAIFGMICFIPFRLALQDRPIYTHFDLLTFAYELIWEILNSNVFQFILFSQNSYTYALIHHFI